MWSCIITLPEREKREGYHSLLTVRDTRDSGLNLMDFSPIVKGLEIKWELRYFRRKKKHQPKGLLSPMDLNSSGGLRVMLYKMQ